MKLKFRGKNEKPKYFLTIKYKVIKIWIIIDHKGHNPKIPCYVLMCHAILGTNKITYL